MKKKYCFFYFLFNPFGSVYARDIHSNRHQQTRSDRCTQGTYIPRATAVTVVACAVARAATADAIDTSPRKSKMIKFVLLYNGKTCSSRSFFQPETVSPGPWAAYELVSFNCSRWTDVVALQGHDQHVLSRTSR